MKTNLRTCQNGNIQIPYYTWPLPQPKAVIIFLHGLKSHAAWFLESGELLANRGIQAYAFDRRGSGSSKLPRGDIRSYQEWLEDIQAIMDVAKEDHPDLAPHLLGHCFGSKLALAFEAQNPKKCKSLILIAPPQFALKVDLSFKHKWRVFLYWLSRQNFQVPVPIKDEWFTRRPEKLQFIKEDQLRLQKMTARFCWEVFKVDRRINQSLRDIKTPALILTAQKDEIVDNQKIREKFFPRLGSSQKKYEEFDCYHHLLFEPLREVVVNRLVEWAEALS